jgi:pheganomycin biosynthesis PGM1-like protein/ATP-grasp domain-containing protein
MTTFCADDESWESFGPKIDREGAIVEQLLRHTAVASPSAQLRIAPTGDFELLSTHDQILGGPDNQVYLGCRYPARDSYRHAIRTAGEAVARVLSSRGVIGYFGVDFVLVPDGSGGDVYLSEINLRMGGTTHPFLMAKLAMGGERPFCYVASDNLKSAHLVGRSPADVIDTVSRAGLAFDAATGTGATLHLLGALRDHGKMGLTCIGASADAADDLYREVTSLLTGL